MNNKIAKEKKAMLSDRRNSRDSSPANYNLRRDHSMPKRFLEDGFVVGNRSPSSKSPSTSPQKIAKKRQTPVKRQLTQPVSPAKQQKREELQSPPSSTSSLAAQQTQSAAEKKKAEEQKKKLSPAKADSSLLSPPKQRKIKKENQEQFGGGGSEPHPEGGSPRKGRGGGTRPLAPAARGPPGSPSRAQRNQRVSATSDLSGHLKENLRRLKNLLKLPKARRWVYCEFFYSDIDQQLFLGDNEFCQCLRESFPNLKTRNLTGLEWTQIRRLIGKPRRCSQAFFDEERSALELKRQKIRDIHNGVLLSLDSDLVDIPTKIPPALIVGSKVYARVRPPRQHLAGPNVVYTKDGIFSGTIDAVMHKSYRIIFEKEVVRPAVVMDFEVMRESGEDLISVSYYLEKNRATAPLNLRAATTTTSGPPQLFLSPQKVLSADSSPLLHYDPVLSAAVGQRSPKPGGSTSKTLAGGGSKGDEKVGNFPVRLLVMLVKLGKLIEIKRTLVRHVQELNGQAERINLIGDYYPRQFQEKYAQVVVDLEQLNKQIHAYLCGVGDYQSSLLPQLSEVTLTSRPDALRKLCHTHAQQIVKHCNNGLNVQSKRILELISSLTALLLQVRSLGQQSSDAYELNTLSEALNGLRLQVSPKNAGSFQDNVEVHLKQIHYSLLAQQSKAAAEKGGSAVIRG